MSLALTTTFDPASEETRLLGQGLNQHAVERLPRDGFNPVAVFVRNDNDEILGGVSGYLNWNWLQISLLWVDASLRGQGFGRQLMEKLEATGRDKGCAWAHVDTFSFQARGFYEALGYKVFATLGDYPPGHARHYLKKRL